MYLPFCQGKCTKLSLFISLCTEDEINSPYSVSAQQISRLRGQAIERRHVKRDSVFWDIVLPHPMIPRNIQWQKQKEIVGFLPQQFHNNKSSQCLRARFVPSLYLYNSMAFSQSFIYHRIQKQMRTIFKNQPEKYIYIYRYIYKYKRI